jgi:hypothetical protein
VQNIVCTVAGFYSAIDPKSAIWNKGLNLTQILGLRYTPTQLDALTKAKINVLRYKGANTAPVLLHDRTAAIIDSDFTFVLRMNIHDLVISTICARADQYEGQSTLDGLQMTSMKSAMATSPSPPRRFSRTRARPLLRQDTPQTPIMVHRAQVLLFCGVDSVKPPCLYLLLWLITSMTTAYCRKLHKMMAAITPVQIRERYGAVLPCAERAEG